MHDEVYNFCLDARLADLEEECRQLLWGCFFLEIHAKIFDAANHRLEIKAKEAMSIGGKRCGKDLSTLLSLVVEIQRTKAAARFGPWLPEASTGSSPPTPKKKTKNENPRLGISDLRGQHRTV